MTIINLDPAWTCAVVHDEVDAATDPPDDDTDILNVGINNCIRTAIDYTGEISAAEIQCWFYINGAWRKGPVTEDDTALDPTAGTQTIDWVVGRKSRVHFQISELVGEGTITVTAQAVEL